MRASGLALTVLLGCVAAAPAAEIGESQADGILTRALLERGAFIACAELDPEAPALREQLARGWALDLGEAVAALRAAGLPAAYVDSLTERFALDAAIPPYADREELGAFCTMLGDWQDRYFILLYSLPQLEIGRIVRQ